MMAITTSNSIRVNPRRTLLSMEYLLDEGPFEERSRRLARSPTDASTAHLVVMNRPNVTSSIQYFATKSQHPSFTINLLATSSQPGSRVGARCRGEAERCSSARGQRHVDTVRPSIQLFNRSLTASARMPPNSRALQRFLPRPQDLSGVGGSMSAKIRSSWCSLLHTTNWPIGSTM